LSPRKNPDVTTCPACGSELPADARFCASCGAAVGSALPIEERKLATILFADLVGSTELGEQDPERTRALLDRFYDAMATEIEGAGGTVEKFIGDAVMAAFGAPLALEDHAERALHAALSMQRRFEELFGDRLALRIGVNTGKVVLGRAREGSSFVTGDAVNVAQRLEAAADGGEILAGERTVAAVRGAFEFAEPMKVEAKGKRGGVECRRVLRSLSLMRPRGLGDLKQAFVGRDDELAQLQATYRTAVDERAPRVVTILGDAGVGKTRLVRELWQWLGAQSPAPVRRTGRCLSYGQATAYWPLGEVLREHLDLLESDSPQLARDKLAGREILGLTLGLDVAGDLHPLEARDRLHDAWTELLGEVARERPVVLLIEDLHWAEPELFELLGRVARDVEGPVLLLATARPEVLEARPGWGAATATSALIRLEPLSAVDSERLVQELLAIELPDELRDVVVTRAEGNPFFVEELIATLIDRNLLRRSNGGWRLGELPTDFAVPDSVEAVLAARIDLLAPAEKSALQAAAVIGRVFWTGPVYELLEGLEPDLRVLEERDFIRRRPGSSMAGEREYAIKHALTREVAYASLPKARRARLHAAFAQWVERLSEGRDENAALLGHHYAEAIRPEDVDLVWPDDDAEVERLRRKAVGWLRRAAELATGRYELAEARELLTRALALEPDKAGQAELWRQIGGVHALNFDGEPFRAAMERSLELSVDRQVSAETYAELAYGTAIRTGMWRTRPPVELVEGWIDRALDLADRDSRARAMALIARCLWQRHDVREAAREANALAERLGDVELRAQALAALYVAAFAQGEFQEALEWTERQLELADDIHDADLLADIYEFAIPSYIAMGRFREARDLARKQAKVVEPLTPHHRLHGVSVQLEVEESSGGWDAILALAERTEQAVEANLATPCIRNARTLLVTALAAAQQGDDARARELERRAQEVQTAGYDLVLSAPRIRLALLRGEINDVDLLPPPLGEYGAQTWFALPAMSARLDALAELGDRERVEQEAQELAKPSTYLEPFALRALGRVRRDRELIERAAELFDAMGLAWHAAETRALLA
jgi:class 3 adenylate cyclase/tetratricopeptide (TPR) repeat protein